MPTLRRGAFALVLSSTLVAGCQSAVDLAGQRAAGAGTQSCQKGGTLVVASAQAPIPNRVLAQSAANLFWVRGVFEPLAGVKDGDVRRPEMLLATAMNFRDDDRTAVLALREGVTFHSGRPFTSADVLFTFKQALDAASPSNHKPIIASWQVEATGDHEVTIRAKTPLSPVLAAGLGTATDLVWPDGPEYPKDLQNKYPYDANRARQMIQQAGAAGTEVPITIINNPQLQAEYQIIANNLTEAGLRPTVVALAAPDYQARLAAGTAGNFLSFRGQMSTPSLVAQANPDVRLQGAHRQFTSPEYTALVNSVIEAPGGQPRVKAVHDLSEYMLDQAVQHVLVSTPSITVKSTSVQGITFTSGGLLSRETCLTT